MFTLDARLRICYHVPMTRKQDVNKMYTNKRPRPVRVIRYEQVQALAERSHISIQDVVNLAVDDLLEKVGEGIVKKSTGYKIVRPKR